MNKVVKGIVLNTTDYKENDKILTILTFGSGKIQVLARGVRKSNSKFKAFCQPFCFAEFELVKGNINYILTGVNCIDTFFDLTIDYDKFFYAIGVVELLDKICVENQDYDNLIIKAISCIKDICYSNSSPKLLICKFIVYLLSIEGFNFITTNCSICNKKLTNKKYLNLSNGELVCNECSNNNCIELENSIFSTLKILYENDYEKLHTVKIPSSVLNKTLDLLLKNISFRYEIYLKSFKEKNF